MKLTIKVFVGAAFKEQPPRLKEPVCSRVVGLSGLVVPVFWSVTPVGEHPRPRPTQLSEGGPRCSPSEQALSWLSQDHSLGEQVFKTENGQADIMGGGRRVVRPGFWLVTACATEVVIVMWN